MSSRPSISVFATASVSVSGTPQSSRKREISSGPQFVSSSSTFPALVASVSTSSGFCTFLPASGVTSGCPALGRSGSCALTFGTALALAAAASMSGLTLVSISGLTLVGLTSAGRLASMSGFLVTSTSFGRLFGDATSLGLSC